MQNTKKQNLFSSDYIFIPLFLIISFCFLSMLSASTSPFYIGYGGDSANYLAMGNMFLNGLIPYLDFFDHKGPMIVFIEAFAQSIIPDRSGVFLLQVVNLTFSLYFIFLTGRIFLTKTNSLSVTLIALFFFAFTIEAGNLTEEYSLLFISIATYFTVKYLFSTTSVIRPLHIFWLGVCGGFLFWMRLNNFGMVCACSIILFIACIKEKDWKGLRNLVVFFFIGFAIVSIPVLLYFYWNDALEEMLFASFIYNFRYAGTNVSADPFRDLTATFFYFLKAWMPFFVLLVGTILFYLKEKNYKILLISFTFFVLGYITTHIGATYYHYMTLNIPCLVLGSIFIIKSFERKEQPSKWSVVICITAGITLLAFSAFKFKNMGGGTAGDSHYINEAKSLVESIPENERNSIFAYQTMTRFHASSGVMPYYKNFMMQEWQGKYNSQIITDINHMMENNPPKWLVTQFRDQSTNLQFWQIVDKKYDLYLKNDIFELFRLKK